MTPDYRPPALPDNQRWSIHKEFFFVIVRLQERRWWGWRTIASSTETVDSGAPGVERCIKQIVLRDHYARLRAEREEGRRRREAEIPFGTFGPK